MAARKRKLTLNQNWRDNIRASILMDHLYRNVLGTLKMTAIQVKSAQIILSKLEPDLAAIQHSGGIDVEIRNRSDAELEEAIRVAAAEAQIAIAAAGESAAAEAP